MDIKNNIYRGKYSPLLGRGVGGEVFLFLVAMLCSCNGDVFVERVDVSDELVLLDGNGDEKTIRISGGECNTVEISAASYSSIALNAVYDGCRLFDEDGNIVSDVANPNSAVLDGLGKAVFYGSNGTFTVERPNKNELRIANEDNFADVRHAMIELLLGSNYSGRVVRVKIGTASECKLDSVVYKLDDWTYLGEYCDNFEDVSGLCVENTTDQPLKCTLKPYENAKHKVTFNSDDAVAFNFRGIGAIPEIPVPMMVDMDEPLKTDTHVTPYGDGEILNAWHDNTKVEVAIPPHKMETLKPLVCYHCYETEYVMYISNPFNGKQHAIRGRVRCDMPYDYVITKWDIKDI